ncbi:MAG: hypothetical protein MUE85_14395 [Microscillaceae bacterium]|jgi:tetratricopeptide (TPR) repeat protein|nr:hypothetical protein [Microscillaceae bacterium]
MKIKVLIIFLLIFFASDLPLFAQIYLSNAELETRASYFQKKNQTDSANYYSQMLIDRYEFNDEDKYIFWQQMLINNLLNNWQLDKALTLGQNLSKSVSTPQNKLMIDLSLAFIYFLKYDLNKALEIYQTALKVPTIQSIQKGRVYREIADIYLRQNLLYLALEYEHQAERIYLANPTMSKVSLANLYNSLGSNYLHIQNFGLAQDYFQKILQILDLDQNPNQKILYLSGLASLQEAKKNYRGAIHYHQQDLWLRKERYPAGHPSYVGIFSRLSSAYQHLQQPDSAYYYLQQAENIGRVVFSAKSSNLGYLYLNKADFYRAQNQLDSSLFYTQKALIANEQDFDAPGIYENPPTIQCFDINLLLRTLQTKAQILLQKPNPSRPMRQTAWQAYQLADRAIRKMQQSSQPMADQLRLASIADQLYQQGLEACWLNR